MDQEAKADERFNAIDQRFDEMGKRFEACFDAIEQRFITMEQRQDSFEERTRVQDNRLWSLIAGVLLALFGLLAKMAFFPQGSCCESM